MVPQGSSHGLPRPVVLIAASILLLACTIATPAFLQPQESPQGPATSALNGGESGPTADLSDLSGPWTGQEALTRLGQCQLEGGSDSVTYPVTMIWRVDDEGDVEITLADWPGVYPYTFAGKALPDLSVSLELATRAMCFGAEHAYTAHYVSTFQVSGGGLGLDMEATEVWCPGSCIFGRRFSVSKSLPTP